MNNFEIDGRFSPRGEPDRLVLHPDGRWRRECQPGTYMSYLYGLRFMEIDETFTFHSRSQGQFGNDSTLHRQNAAGDYDVVTHNSLLGLQIGADMTFRQCRWTWGVESKVGPYINFANQVSTIDAATSTARPTPSYNRALSANEMRSGPDRRGRFSSHLQVPAEPDGPRVLGLHVDHGRCPGPEQLQFVADPVARSTPTAPSSPRACRWAWNGCGSSAVMRFGPKPRAAFA